MSRSVKWKVAALIIGLLCVLVPLTARSEGDLTVSIDGKPVRMGMEDYLVCVVAAEMPASYEMEALKAQAIAARTRVAGTGCRSHPEVDVCTDSTCCQGFLDQQAQARRWGEDTEAYRARILEAVRETEGLIMTYDGEPIEVLYHAVSGGYTEDVEQVYHEALPYLRAVPSPGEEDASGYETVQTFTQAELCAAFPDAANKGRVVLRVLERSDTGRVTKLSVGPFTMTGRVFRSALGLKSTNFTLDIGEDAVTIRQKGYGHGVGMSQAGANAMARSGAKCLDILSHYYTGVCFTQWTH